MVERADELRDPGLRDFVTSRPQRARNTTELFVQNTQPGEPNEALAAGAVRHAICVEREWPSTQVPGGLFPSHERVSVEIIHDSAMRKVLVQRRAQQWPVEAVLDEYYGEYHPPDSP